jgi:transcriptional regulator with XRE-family HTH domain
MIERIKKIMEEKGLTTSSFADATGVNATTISFIINGRDVEGKGKVNQTPSTDVITKILNTFPDISADWLFMGTGSMHKGEKAVIAPDLFSQTSVNPVKDTAEPKYRKEIIDKPAEISPKNTKNQSIMPEFPISDNIDKIVIFFKNKTYITLKPEE